ncbi:MAG: ABC transporter permease [Verrucomicrobia bacterium]|nr:ABC transporter permease [Verrucomicrobiota bacterium]
MDNFDLALQLLPLQLWNTIYMVFVSAFFAFLLGLPLGVILTVTDKGHIREHTAINKILGTIVNIGRSFPFAILMVALIPFTRLIVGTSLGTTASIVPLTIAAAPFVARLVESSLKEIDRNILEAALVMGSTPWQIVQKVLLCEALPSIISGMTLTLVNLIGYSAMAGLVGGGGLGQVAIQYGYNRFNTTIMVLTVALLIVLVQVIQWIGNKLVQSILKKRGKLTHD